MLLEYVYEKNKLIFDCKDDIFRKHPSMIITWDVHMTCTWGVGTIPYSNQTCEHCGTSVTSSEPNSPVRLNLQSYQGSQQIIKSCR